MKKLFTLAFLAICFQCIYGQNHIVDEVIWVVGDEAILRSDIERVRNAYGSDIKGNPYCVIPEQMAIQKLFLHQAAIDSISVSEGDIAPYVEQDISKKVLMAGSKEKLEEYMRMPMSQIREELSEQYKNEMTAMKMKQKITADIKITPAEVRKYFRDLPQDSLPYIPTQVEVQILTRHPRIRREEIDRVKEQLRGWAERIQSGTTSFSALARMFSKDEESARMGGELDYYGRTQLDPAIANVAFSLTDPKKVSKVVQSEYGFHIVQLIDKRGDKVKIRHILRRPEIDPNDIEACMMRLDSIAMDIRGNKFSFENGAQDLSDDKDSRNNHGIMTNINQDTGVATTRFEMADLPSEIARIVDKMEIGEISKAFTMTDKHGMETCAIVKLKNRIPAHRASITEDFQILKGTVEAKKSDEMIQQWIKEKQRSTYVRINEDWRNCDFTYPGWVK